MLVIGDADALIALSDISDVNHKKAKDTLSFLSHNPLDIYFPATALAEAITTAQRKMDNRALAQLLVSKVVSNDLAIFPINSETLSLAASLFDSDSSKQNTFFDAIVAAIAKKNAAVAIFSFDSWYKKKGFILASDLQLN
jgi:predicted nucleic acid-binding protein